MKDLDYAKKLLSADIGALYAMLAAVQDRSSLHAFDEGDGEPPEKLVERGKQLLEKKYSLICDTLCGHPRVKDFISSDESDEAKLLLLVCDVLSTISIGLPPFYVSAILVKIGIRRMCKEAE